jgi:hypothetical protein
VHGENAVKLMKIGVLTLLTCSIALMAFSQEQHQVQPEAGFVPNEVTATRVADAILIPIYGQSQVESERPFAASLSGNIWKVTGHLPDGVDGGVAEVWVDKREGRILRVNPR